MMSIFCLRVDVGRLVRSTLREIMLEQRRHPRRRTAAQARIGRTAGVRQPRGRRAEKLGEEFHADGMGEQSVELLDGGGPRGPTHPARASGGVTVA